MPRPKGFEPWTDLWPVAWSIFMFDNTGQLTNGWEISAIFGSESEANAFKDNLDAIAIDPQDALNSKVFIHRVIKFSPRVGEKFKFFNRKDFITNNFNGTGFLGV